MDLVHSAFVGFARVELSQLSYKGEKLCEYLDKLPPSVRKRVNSLVKVFEHEGCIREERHAIHVIVNDVSEDLQFPKDLPIRVTELPRLQSEAVCIHGIHRALAGCEHLAPNDQWWIARVFTRHLPIKEEERIVEEYGNEQPRTDGLIFCEILKQRKTGGHESKVKEKVQLARLSNGKRKELRQLLDRTDLFHSQTSYFELFSNLTKWVGLWPTIQLGVLHRLLPMKCDHELVNYLRYIHDTWTAIVAGVECNDPEMVDEQTVICLETAFPGVSKADRDRINGEITGRTIFRKITSNEDRERIKHNIHKLPGMIPSLFTFLEGLKYLEPCAKIMLELCDPKQKICIREALQRVHHPPADLTVEYAEKDVRNHVALTENAFEIGYQQLWLFAHRNFPQMSSATTLLEPDEARPQSIAQNPLLWKAFGELAARVGFKNERILELVAADAVRRLATQVATSFGAQVEALFVDEIAAVLRRKKIAQENISDLSLVSVKGLLPKFRCGKPFTKDHLSDRIHLFLPKLHSPVLTELVENVSTFYCKREIFNRFLGGSLAEEDFTAPAVAEISEPDITNASRDTCSRHMIIIRELQAEIDLQASQIERLQSSEDIQDAEFDKQVFGHTEDDNQWQVEDQLRLNKTSLEKKDQEIAQLRRRHAESMRRLEGELAELEEKHENLEGESSLREERWKRCESDNDQLTKEIEELKQQGLDSEIMKQKLIIQLTEQRQQLAQQEVEDKGFLILKVGGLYIDGTECYHILKIRTRDDALARMIVNELCRDEYRSHIFKLQKWGDPNQKVVAYRDHLTGRVLLDSWKSGGPTLVVELQRYGMEIRNGKKRKLNDSNLGIEKWLRALRVEMDSWAPADIDAGFVSELLESDSEVRRKVMRPGGSRLQTGIRLENKGRKIRNMKRRTRITNHTEMVDGGTDDSGTLSAIE